MKNSDLIKEICLQRIQKLFELAEKRIKQDKENSKKLIKLAEKISSYNKVLIPKKLKEKYCKKCKLILIEGFSCKTRVENKKIIKHCLDCKAIKKVYLSSKSKVFKASQSRS